MKYLNVIETKNLKTQLLLNWKVEIIKISPVQSLLKFIFLMLGASMK